MSQLRMSTGIGRNSAVAGAVRQSVVALPDFGGPYENQTRPSTEKEAPPFHSRHT